MVLPSGVGVRFNGTYSSAHLSARYYGVLNASLFENPICIFGARDIGHMH